mgnify:CR=1 FL=1
MRASEKTRRLTGLALMTAIIVVLQVVASFVKFGPFTITLALAPILIGAALYGPKAGACLGGVFGAVVLLACILGWDPGGAILWNANPFLTALVCLVILLTDIHPALYVKLSLVTFNNTFIKGGKEDDFLHDGVCRTHMFVNRIRYTLRPCLLYKRKQEANPNPYKQQTFQPQFLLIESGQIYGRICVMQKHVP